jgi:CheY-like chemotaxis protein
MTSVDQAILLVEDSPTQIMSIRALLEEQGVNLIFATDGEMGLNMAKELLPALIIMDLQMPRMNGLQVIEGLKSNKATASIPIIMLSAHDDAEAQILALQLGAVDYITKDVFVNAVLLATLRQMGFIKNKQAKRVE